MSICTQLVDAYCWNDHSNNPKCIVTKITIRLSLHPVYLCSIQSPVMHTCIHSMSQSVPQVWLPWSTLKTKVKKRKRKERENRQLARACKSYLHKRVVCICVCVCVWRQYGIIKLFDKRLNYLIWSGKEGMQPPPRPTSPFSLL